MEDDGNADTSTYYIFIPWYNNALNYMVYINHVNTKYTGRSPAFH